MIALIIVLMAMVIFKRIPEETAQKRGPRWEGCSSVLRLWRGLQEPLWGIKLGLALQQMISMVGQCAHGFENLILMDFDLLKKRIRPTVPEWCHVEIWTIWERNTESVREKYISRRRWQIQSQVVRNTIRRANAVMLLWTEIQRQLQIAVQMQAQIYK